MNSKLKTPSIPLGEPVSWEDWLSGRKARRQTSKRVAPGILRRDAGPHDIRLRKLFKDQRGLPFPSAEKLR